MNHLKLVLLFTWVLIAGFSGVGQDKPRCDPAALKDLPLQLVQIGKKQPIDSKCGCTGANKPNQGSAQNKAGALQNSIKNNFLVPAGNPAVVTTADLTRLQEQVDAFTQQQLPRGDRLRLPNAAQRQLLHGLSIGGGRTLGEGDVVALVAFVIGAQHSNVSFTLDGTLTGGESVNCNGLGCARNDIHIDLSAKPRGPNETVDDRMKDDGVVAEISPRHRPAEWNLFDSVSYRDFFNKHPVMFTGQLFYDASHQPLKSPIRRSVWEIHPVYAIHVCRKESLAECDPAKQDDESVWIPFHQLRQMLNLKQVKTPAKCLKAP